jgi:hypothetical protein
MVSQRVAGGAVVATGEPEGCELVMSVYLMVSLQGAVFQERDQKVNRSSAQKIARAIARTHPWWSVGKG